MNRPSPDLDPLPRQPRADGAARVAAKRVGAESRLADLYERGSAKIRLPRARGETLEAVALNTAGGITAGDRFLYEAEAGPGARLTLATQTAERAYRAQPGETPGRLETRLRVAAGARLDWLPQETILFDRCALRRSLEIDMAADATVLAVESVVFGRAAMGEIVADGNFRDSQRLRRGGRLVYADAARFEGPVSALCARPAVLAGARAYATLLFAAPDAEDRLDAVRASLADADAGASAFDGLITARIVSSDGFGLRRILARVLRGLRAGPLPRVWEI